MYYRSLTSRAEWPGIVEYHRKNENERGTPNHPYHRARRTPFEGATDAPSVGVAVDRASSWSTSRSP